MELDKYLVVESRKGWVKYVHLYDSPEDCSEHPFEVSPGVYANTGSTKDPDASGLIFKDKTGKEYAVLRHGIHKQTFDALFYNEQIKEEDLRFTSMVKNAGRSYDKTFKNCTINASSLKKLDFRNANSAKELFSGATIINNAEEDLSLHFEALRPSGCQRMFQNTILGNNLKIHLYGISPSMYQSLSIKDTDRYILEGLVNWENLYKQLDPELTRVNESFVAEHGAWPVNIKNAFNGMEKIEYIETRLFDGYHTIDASYAFQNCKKLKRIDVSFLHGKPITLLTGTFSGCSSLTMIDGLSNISIAKDADIAGLFQGDRCLTLITGLSNWNTSNIRSMANVFRDCNELTGADIQNWKTDNVLDASGMFQGCRQWTKNLEMRHDFMKHVVNINHMFSDVSPALIRFAHDMAIGRGDAMAEVEDFDYLFESTVAPDGIDLSTWHISKSKPMHCKGAFNGTDTPVISLWNNSEEAVTCDYTGAFTNSTVRHINGPIPLNSTSDAIFSNCPKLRGVILVGTESDAMIPKGTLMNDQYFCALESYGGARVINSTTSYNAKLQTYVTKYTIRSFANEIGTHFLHIDLPDMGLVSCFSFRNGERTEESVPTLHNIAVTNEQAGEVELTLKEGTTFRLAVTTESLKPNIVELKPAIQQDGVRLEISGSGTGTLTLSARLNKDANGAPIPSVVYQNGKSYSKITENDTPITLSVAAGDIITADKNLAEWNVVSFNSNGIKQEVWPTIEWSNPKKV